MDFEAGFESETEGSGPRGGHVSWTDSEADGG